MGPLAGWRMGEGGPQHGRGTANPAQIDNYIANGSFWREHIPHRGRVLQAVEPRLSGLGGKDRPV